MGKYDYNKGDEVGIFEIIERTDRRCGGHWYYKVKCRECGCVLEIQNHQIHIAKKCVHLNVNGNYKDFTNSWSDGRLQIIFAHMIQRCYDPKDKNYSIYGGKGIRICEEWINSPPLFEKWALENGYSKELSIDRIDPNKDYSPENCRWVTLSQNSKYKSTTRAIEVDGEKKTGREWGESLGLGTNTINSYYRQYGEEMVKEFIRARKEDPSKVRQNHMTWLEVYGLI